MSVPSTSSAKSAGSSLDMQQLEDLISANADVELQFDDGTLMASSAVLNLFSSVLRGAVEANAGSAQSSCKGMPGSSTHNSSIPLKGVMKDDWLELAGFWYPIVPSPKVEGWRQAEKLLKLGAQFDIKLVLHRVDEWLLSQSTTMTADSSSPDCVWQWLQLADGSGLQDCLAALAQQAVKVDRVGCLKEDSMQGLSTRSMRQLVAMLAKSYPGVGSTWKAHCNYCNREQTMNCRCSICGRVG